MSANPEVQERVDSLMQSIGCAALDCNGLMRHILDCLGALKIRIKDDKTVNQSLKNVFRAAAISFLDHITAFDPIDSNSALKHLMEVFPDEVKRRDGRSWLPLHWAAALESTTVEDLRIIVRDRPLVAKMEHTRVPGKIVDVNIFSGCLS